MGQAYCVTLCGQRNELQILQIEELTKNTNDQPKETFAKRVKQHIELNIKVKDIYLIYRQYLNHAGMHHLPEQAGFKLDLYYLFSYSAYYDGEWKHGVPHGFGRIIYDDGSLYEGCFKYGVANCTNALFIRKDGTFYRGQIMNNKANGEGQLTTNHLFYKGSWRNDLPHGKAKQIYSQTSYYQGYFQNGSKNGDGYYKWSEHQSYLGTFKNNKLQGKGKLQTKQYIYKGQFRSSKKQGFGQYTDKYNQFVYVGEFKDNLPKGKGKIVYQDGTEFNGTFNGFDRQKGTLTLSNGTSIDLESNQFQSEGSIQDKKAFKLA